MTQKERQERSKEEIYRAALEEFGTCGYDSVNMERICGKHGISKGMMYHYYANKDELFLLCVQRTFADLKAYVERDAGELSGSSVLETIKNYFMIREYFFQLHPRQKVVFETALLRPPKHLEEQIQILHAPIREMNRQFLGRLVAKMPLRPGLDAKQAARYLESVEFLFKNALMYYKGEQAHPDLHTMLESVGELLNMILFGVLQQTDVPAVSSPPPIQHGHRNSGRKKGIV